MSSEKSKTVEEQLRFSSLIWSAVRLVDYPRRICLSKPKSFNPLVAPDQSILLLVHRISSGQKSRFFPSEFKRSKCTRFRSSIILLLGRKWFFSTNFWKSFGDSIGRAVFVSFRFVSSRNNNNLEGKTDRSTVLTFSLFLFLRFIATSR